MLLKWIARGLMTCIPGFNRCGRESEEGAISARYCYSVWLRHLVMAARRGLPVAPRVVAELGPGDSLGIGIAALLSGVEAYYALDVVQYARTKHNLDVMEECVRLFASRADIPGDDEFPKIYPRLDSYAFPSDILPDERLARSLRSSRIEAIRSLLNGKEGPGVADVALTYFAPWTGDDILRVGSVDMVISQAVLEHVDDLGDTYRCLSQWVKPGGIVSSVIDFKSHGVTSQWNGHWALSDFTWKMIRGRRPYLLNRQPHSAHIRLMEKSGFRVVVDRPTRRHTQIGRRHLALQFRDMTDEDLVTSEAYVLAVRPTDRP